MSILTLLHVCSAILATLLGAIALAQPKGSPWHKLAGYCFFVSMLTTDITGFLFLPKHGFSFFQLLSLWNLTTLVAGIYFVAKKPGQDWLLKHFYFVNYAYLGVVAAAAARVPQLFGIAPDLSALIGIGFVFGIGSFCIEKHAKQLTTTQVTSTHATPVAKA